MNDPGITAGFVTDCCPSAMTGASSHAKTNHQHLWYLLMDVPMLDLYLVHLLPFRYLDLINLLSKISAPPPYNKGSARRRDLRVGFLDMLEVSPLPSLEMVSKLN